MNDLKHALVAGSTPRADISPDVRTTDLTILHASEHRHV
jgi:hypothetical protein